MDKAIFVVCVSFSILFSVIVFPAAHCVSVEPRVTPDGDICIDACLKAEELGCRIETKVETCVDICARVRDKRLGDLHLDCWARAKTCEELLHYSAYGCE